MPRRRRPLMERLRDREVRHLAPLWRRSLVESSMRKKTTRADRIISALFIVAVIVILIHFLPGCLGHR